MSENLTYEHKGVKIELLAGSGEFYAKIGDKEVFKPSLAAMKKVIENGVKDKLAFEPPITMLTLTPRARGYRGGEPEYSERPIEDFREQVIRLDKSKRRWTNTRYQFISKGGHSYSDLIEDTPENYKRIIAYWKASEAEDKRHRAAQEKIDELREAIPEKSATEVAAERGVT